MGARKTPEKGKTSLGASLVPVLEDTPYVNPDVAAAEAGEEVEFNFTIQE